MKSTRERRGVLVDLQQQAVGFGTERWANAALHLARRFRAGATLWCVAPQWPWHADHVVVEFVHPVIVGKRALPAGALRAADWVDELRRRSRPGDVFMAIGRSGEPTLMRAAHRAPVWGLSVLWLQVGGSEIDRAGSHHLPVDGADPAFGGELVRAYHLLWELTHVCFEHPGHLVDPDASVADGHCVTCSDEGRLAEILELRANAGAVVRSAGGVEKIDTTLVAGAGPGDVVLVHAGTAISVVAESELGVGW